ncbi:MAG: hypothetical protein NW218_11540 [Saprospiraceae bacterium]|nr:hypothetical protein [Saprospiraceae bacterium]
MKQIRLFSKKIALVLVVLILNQVFFPAIALALTSGPTQPEAYAFTPATTNDMVDLFSGDFHYNIPLLDLEGYPINIGYSAGPGMEEEASWVGLGWTLNPGSINREMRGLPDDFRGDTIIKTVSIKPDITTGVNVGFGAELVGLPLRLASSSGIYYNTYRGYGLNAGFSAALSLTKFINTPGTIGLGVKFDSQNGVDLTPSAGFGLSAKMGKIEKFNINSSLDINSRRGLRDMSVSFNVLKGSVSFAGTTYIPVSSLPLSNQSFTYHQSGGGEFFGVNPYGSLDGYRSVQKLIANRQVQSAYGYLHGQYARISDLEDFNRERNGLPWREYMPVLPPAYGTYDHFTASGQGVSGQFHAIRNDIGYFRDAFHKNESLSASLGVEAGVGNSVKIGVDVNITNIDAYAKDWVNENALSSATGFTDIDGKSPYEPVFFKSESDLVITDSAYLARLGNYYPVQPDLEKNSGAIKPAMLFASNQRPAGRAAFSTAAPAKRIPREKRNIVMQYLTAKEASKHGLEKNIISYNRWQIRTSASSPGCAIDNTLSRTRFKGHHISEISVLQPGGSRYVYGLPAYNTLQKEVSFSVSNAPSNTNGVVQYAVGDNSVNNNKGRENYFNAEQLPPYAYAYYLTGVLSPDYIDRTNNGITPDDYGSAIRINYTKNASLFQWRTPIGADSVTTVRAARYQPGRVSDPKDDKASYIYGKKEVWYVHSIESANLVAQFYTSTRLDGLGVVNEDGTINTDTTASLRKLDKIVVYSKNDLKKNGSSAIPIKTVNFVYAYELCQGVPNSTNPNVTGGKTKLTLKSIYFTYGKSTRGKLNAYSFAYKNTKAGANTLYYNMAYLDRWGGYKINPASYPSNTIFPYALQDASITAPGGGSLIDYYAGAWSLSEITLPSGGKIGISYEADDYAYVQNKRAGQMFFVRGFSKPGSYLESDIGPNLYDGTGNMNKYVWVDVSAMNLPNNTLPDINSFKTKCMEGIDNIYFNMDVVLLGSNRENITGYMQYDNTQSLQSIAGTGGNLASVGIPVKIVTTDKNNPIHPVTKAALQTMRLELPDLAYPGTEAGTAFVAVVKSLVGAVQTVGDALRGFDENAMKASKAKTVGVTKTGNKSSWIRLCNPTYKKFGGGYRVKQISMTDNWSVMTGSTQPGARYGQSYNYTKSEKVLINNIETTLNISSGVASWEPSYGNDENLWREPAVTFTDKIILAPDNSYYVEKPFGESLFPAPSVGYSEVKVMPLAYTTNKRSGSGWNIFKFYTARDFPTIVDYSAPARHKDKSHKLRKFFKILVKDYLEIAQGFSVEVNDMHGKMKQEAMFAQNGSLISSTTYEYKVDDVNASPLHLNNLVKVIKPDGNIGLPRTLGVNIDVWQDFREEVTQTSSSGFSANSDAFYAFIPIILFLGMPILHKEDLRFRSAVTMKHIKRHGILSKVTKFQDGSTISTENLLYDIETGDVIATKTQNEFEDPIYALNYPAHWKYEGMSMAYKNVGLHLVSLYFRRGIPYLSDPNSGQPTNTILPNYESFLTEGDEFGGKRSPAKWSFANDTLRLTTYRPDPTDTLRFYNDKGARFASGTKRYDLYLIRPGRRNQQNTPIGSIVSRTSPLGFANVTAYASAAGNQIIDATAAVYGDDWQRDCKCLERNPIDTINPYKTGMKGNWRLKDQYANHRTRNASKIPASQGVTNIRTDGANISFQPFWTYSSNKWNQTSDPKWILSNSATIYDAKGNEIEEKDALGIFKSAGYGYSQRLNTSVVDNAKIRQTLNFNFEDNNYNTISNCENTGCIAVNNRQEPAFFSEDILSNWGVSDSLAHSGKSSFRLASNLPAVMYVSVDTSTSVTKLKLSQSKGIYLLGANGCLPVFKPDTGDYYISYWINTKGVCNTGVTGPKLQIFQSSATPTTIDILPSGPVIDGWQRGEGKVKIVQKSGSIGFLLNNPLNRSIYFDDLRIMPWKASMKSYVYDPITLRLMATLDENNYATFYEYDEEGMLARIKRETERGIMTIEEHRSALKY